MKGAFAISLDEILITAVFPQGAPTGTLGYALAAVMPILLFTWCDGRTRTLHGLN